MKKIVILCLISVCMIGCSSQAKKQFMMGCVSTPKDEKICECGYDALESAYGEEKMEKIALGQTPVPDDFFEILVKAQAVCT